MRTLLTNRIDDQAVKVKLSANTGLRRDDSVGSIRAAPRSSRYLHCLAQPDAPSGDTLDASELVEAIESEFGLREAMPIGCVAKCYLGEPYEVHLLDLAGGIVEHYYSSQALPLPFERARRLALHEAYVAIEVYPDRLVCLHADGTAVTVNQ